jgi:hypothetical protein
MLFNIITLKIHCHHGDTCYSFIYIQRERKFPVHLLQVGYSEYTYGYNKCWKWPPWVWDYVTEVT